MDIYYGCQVTNKNRKNNLISIGVIDDFGRIFYAEFNDYGKKNLGLYNKDHSLPSLKMRYAKRYYFFPIDEDCAKYIMKGSKKEIAAELIKWIKLGLDYTGDCDVTFIGIDSIYTWKSILDLLLTPYTGDSIKLPFTINGVIDIISIMYFFNINIHNFNPRNYLLSIGENREYLCKGIISNSEDNALYIARVVALLYINIIIKNSKKLPNVKKKICQKTNIWTRFSEGFKAWITKA